MPKLISIVLLVKVSKGANIRNRYNQVPYLAQDTNGKVANSELHHIKVSIIVICKKTIQMIITVDEDLSYYQMVTY